MIHPTAHSHACTPPVTHTCSKFHTIDPQILHANVQNLVIQVTWQPGFVLLCLQ